MKNAVSSFNRFRFFTAAVFLVSVPCLFAQYSDSTLNGPWLERSTVLDTFAVDNLGYFVFDGVGSVTDISRFNMGCSGFIGNYSVKSNDSFSLDLKDLSCMTLPYTGQLISNSSATYMSGTRKLWKVPKPGALADSLVGVLNSPVCGQKNIALFLDSTGMVTSGTGLEGLSGSVFADSGLFIGHLKSIDNTKCSDSSSGWYEFSIAGKYSNDSLKGILYFNDSSNDTGTVLLVRKSMTTSVIKKGAVVRPQRITCRAVRGGVLFVTLKNPVDENLQIRVMDLSGRIVASRVVQCASGSNAAQLDLGRLSRGAYIVHLQAGGFSVQNRIAIQ